MWDITRIEKAIIISDSLRRKAGFLPGWFLDPVQLTIPFEYKIRIQLRPDDRFTFSSIRNVALMRIWTQDPEMREGRIWTSGAGETPLQKEHFNNTVWFDYHEENWANSLSLISLLALKTLYDYLRPCRRKGLLFRSEVYALRELKKWIRRDRELDRIVSKIFCTKKRPPDAPPAVPSHPLIDRFLVDSNEIYALVCWTGGNDDFEEKVWALNVQANNIELSDHSGHRLWDKDLKKVLSCFFPEDALRTDDEIAKYENSLRNKVGEKKIFFPAEIVPEVTSAWIKRDAEATQSILEQLETRSKASNDIPREIIPFSNIFKDHPSSAFVGRTTVLRSMRAFARKKTVSTQYLLLIGESGIGKTALMAHFVATWSGPIAYYFLEDKKTDRSHPIAFVEHLYGTLGHIYGLNTSYPHGHGRLSLEPLRSRIKQVGKLHLAEHETQVIVVDAIDEAHSIVQDDHPIIGVLRAIDFPSNFRILLSSRPVRILDFFKAPGNSNVIGLIGRENENIKDLRTFLMQKLHNKRANQRAIGLLVDRSEGNFQYAKLVVDSIVDSIEDMESLLRDPPEGLYGIYDWKLSRIRGQVSPDTFQTICQVIQTISLVPEALEPRLISDILGISSIDRVLGPLEQFLDLDTYWYQRKCRWYHTSFGEYALDPERPCGWAKDIVRALLAQYTERSTKEQTLSRLPFSMVATFCLNYDTAYGRKKLLDFMRYSFLPVALRSPDPNVRRAAYANVIGCVASAIGAKDPQHIIYFYFMFRACCEPFLAVTGSTTTTEVKETLRQTGTGPASEDRKERARDIATAAVSAFVRATISSDELAERLDNAFSCIESELSNVLTYSDVCNFYAQHCFPKDGRGDVQT